MENNDYEWCEEYIKKLESVDIESFEDQTKYLRFLDYISRLKEVYHLFNKEELIQMFDLLQGDRSNRIIARTLINEAIKKDSSGKLYSNLINPKEPFND